MSNTRNVPNCSDFAGKVGDKGQRFEIRYVKTVYDTTSTPGIEIRKAGEEKVFGWAGTLEGAREMRDSAKLAPWCFDAWVIDRKALTVRELARALQELPEQGAFVIINGLVTEEDSDADLDDSETPYCNVTSVQRLPDGRILIE